MAKLNTPAATAIVIGTTLFLCGCHADSDTTSGAPSETKPKKLDADLEQLVFTPTKLTLKQANKKYGTKLFNDPKRDSVALTAAGEFAGSKGDNDAAETLLTEAIRLNDKNSVAYYWRGRIRCNGIAGKDKAAMADLQKAIALGFSEAEVYLVLARLLDADKQPQKALEALAIGIELDPTNRDMFKSRAAINAALGHKEEALKDYQQLAKLDPESTAPLFQQAQVYESMKKFDEAGAIYRKMLPMSESKQKVPLKAIAYKRLALLSSNKQQHREAIDYLSEAMKFDPEDDEPIRMRGLEYMKIKEYEKAIADFTEAIDIVPDSASNFSARADAYEKLGKAELAEKDRAEAKRLHDVPAERPMFEMK